MRGMLCPPSWICFSMASFLSRLPTVSSEGAFARDAYAVGSVAVFAAFFVKEDCAGGLARRRQAEAWLA